MSTDVPSSKLEERAKYAMHLWFLVFSDTLPPDSKIGIRLNFEWSGYFSANLFISVKEQETGKILEVPYLDQYRPTRAATPEIALDNLIYYLEADTNKQKKPKAESKEKK